MIPLNLVFLVAATFREGDIYLCSEVLLLENCLIVTNSNYEDFVRILTGKMIVNLNHS